ncbi:MAG TPA: chloride channel protein [Hyphomicrobiaceae bacterium]|nr:chloride channel protein [Hyphomicrobiaceae bacterium]
MAAPPDQPPNRTEPVTPPNRPSSGSGSGRLRIWAVEARTAVASRLSTNVSDFLADRQFLVWCLALAIGIGVAYAAISFRLLIGVVQLSWLGSRSENVFAAAAKVPWYVILLAPAMGGLIVGTLLHRFLPGRRAPGVADVIEARALGDCKIPVVQGLWGATLSILSLGFGASAGREGPVVHLGATLASWLEDRFQLSQGARRTLLASGAAAAVSASFNAPMAGVLFAHEVILAHYALRAFVPIVIASVAGAIIARIHLGNFPAFTVPEYSITSYLEFPAFALLGVTCAVVAIVFELALMTTERVAWSFKLPLWARPAIGGLMVGAIAVFFPQVLGVGYDATGMALTQQFELWLLLALIVAKTAATSITLASRFAGGVFSPSLYLGAMTGCAFGFIATSAFPEMASSNGLYALLGAGAVAGAVLGAPISSTLIVFELTGGYNMTIALLLTVSIAHGLTQAALGHSYFHWQLTKRGLSLQEGPHKEIMRRLNVSDFMTPLDADEPPPIAPDPDEDPWLTPSDTLEQALRTFDRDGVTRIAVVSASDTTRVVGWADRLIAISTFNRELIQSHEEEHK